MKLYKVKSYDELSRKAASVIAAQIINKPDSVLGLATGSTPVGTYQNLVKRYQEGELDFSEIKTANLDEYKGLPRENDQSYYYFMYSNLFRHVNIDMKNTNIPNGMAEDAGAECLRYEAVIKELGGVDLQLLGLGHDGHIGFNERRTDALRRLNRDDHRSKQALLCLRRRGTKTGFHDGNRNYHAGQKDSDDRQRSR